MQTPETWAREGEALVAAATYGSADFARGLELLEKAAAAGSGAAELTLGHVYSQVHLLPDAAREAAAWYRRAAERGDPVAVNRLADLHMQGQGVPQDDAAALALYRRNAERGYAVMQCNLAYMLAEGIGAAPDAAAAFGWRLSAAAQGEPRAYFELGLAFHEGRGTVPDPTLAWAWMENARRQAYPTSDAELGRLASRMNAAALADARGLAERIESNFMRLQQALRRAPEVLSSAERYRALVQQNFSTLGVAACALDAARRPPQAASGDDRHVTAVPQEVATQPRIFTVDEFVSRSECAHLMTLAGLNFQPAEALTRDILSQENRAFTGHMSALRTVLCDAVVRQVERRVAAVFGLPPSHVEPLTVLRYQGGERYAPHVDYFDAARLAENERRGDQAGQRSASFLVYLRPAEAGGETHYIKLGKKIAARPRMALCHYNCLPSGEPDPATLHTGEPVALGEKWLARTTLRERPFY
jgi:prolyl 4-hydroxylase